jgi:uncharacterized membrane protein YtjA (UPF0391 family)
MYVLASSVIALSAGLLGFGGIAFTAARDFTAIAEQKKNDEQS